MEGVREMREGPRAGTVLCALFALEQGWNPAMSDGFDMVSAIEIVEKLVMSVAACG